MSGGGSQNLPVTAEFVPVIVIPYYLAPFSPSSFAWFVTLETIVYFELYNYLCTK
jgi:hypothetical protein